MLQQNRTSFHFSRQQLDAYFLPWNARMPYIVATLVRVPVLEPEATIGLCAETASLQPRWEAIYIDEVRLSKWRPPPEISEPITIYLKDQNRLANNPSLFLSCISPRYLFSLPLLVCTHTQACKAGFHIQDRWN